MLIFVYIVGSLLTSGYVSAFPSPQVGSVSVAESQVPWAALGDSWSSGVAWKYGAGAFYDGKDDLCVKIWNAWAPQLSDDSDSWSPSGPQELSFVGCGGSILNNITKGDNSQISQAGSPRFITLTSGGNDLGFYDVVASCVYHPDIATDYGPDYADDTEGVGLCAKAIADANIKIVDDAYEHILDAMKQIIDAPNIQQRISDSQYFDIFLTGYAHFFNVDTTDCNDWTFGVFGYPKLGQQLRNAMNALIQDVNVAYSQAVDAFNGDSSKPPHVTATYVDISTNFNGHRFCEAGHSLDDQKNSPDVWLWTLSSHVFTGKALDPSSPPPPTNLPWVDNAGTPIPEDTPAADQLVQDAIAQYGLFNALSPSPTTPAGLLQPLLGITSRPFHPTERGHTAVKDAVAAVLKGKF